MKNYGDVKIPKGTIGYESENGHGNWWYPDKNSPREIPIDTKAKHLQLWRNQDPYLVFSIPRCVFKPEELFTDGKIQYVAIWFHKEVIDEIVNKTVV